ncbi:MAG TPA: diadenylate cyclase CdaA [Candidatus Acidoferrales bacterium]
MGFADVLTELLSRLTLRAVMDILVVAAGIYYLLRLLRGARAVQAVAVVVLLAGFYEVARWARLEMVEGLMAAMAPYAAIALIVLYQPEIRRVLARIGRSLTPARFFGSAGGAVFDDVVLAAEYLSANRIGALIVFEREVGLHTYIESGIPLDAHLSYDLLLAIFRPGSPLHDGAVIIQGTRIAGAACFLPLSLNPGISSQVGTRHRAAMGVTEESDAVVVLVSEQTGAISLAVGGTMEFGLTVGQLTERLAALFRRFRATPDLPSPGARVADRVE